MAAVAAEGPKVTFSDCVVVTTADEVSAPCGGCRQMLVEFGTEMKVTCINGNNDYF
jgi:cytidine deaminase